MSTDKISYDTSASMTATLTGLAPSTTAGRQTTVVSNTTNLYDDALVTCSAITNASTPAAGKVGNIYPFGSEDGTRYDGDDAQPGASDAAYTLNASSNLRGPMPISAPAASKTYYKILSLAAFFAGLMPRSWGYVETNDTNNNFGATAPTLGYTGVWYTNS